MALFTPDPTLTHYLMSRPLRQAMGLCLSILILFANPPAVHTRQEHPHTPNVPGSIAGQVTDQQGQAVAGITVAVYAMNTHDYLPAPMRTTQTDQNGFYAVTLLQPSSYLVKFSDPTGTYAFQYYPQAPDWQSAQPILVAGHPVSAIDATLQNGGAITGVIAGATLAPVHLVLYLAHSDQSWTQLLTQQQLPPPPAGSPFGYAIKGLPAALYRLCLQGEDSECYRNRAFTDETLAQAQPITVTAGITTTGIDFRLDDCHADCLTGTIYAPTGQPLAGLHVFWHQKQDHRWIDYTQPYLTGEDGKFWLDVRAGEQYALHVVDPSRTFVDEFYQQAATLEEATLITAQPPTQTHPLTITLTLGAQFTGTVRLQGTTNTYVAGTVVAYQRTATNGWPPEQQATATTEIDPVTGRYTLGGLRAGSYGLQARLQLLPRLAYPQLTEFYGDSQTMTNTTVLTLTTGQTSSDRDFNLGEHEFNSQISGRIFGEREPLAGVTVELLLPTQPDAPLLYTTTDGEGVYRFDGLLSGDYTLRATDPTFAFATRYYGPALIPFPTESIQLKENEQRTDVHITLVRAGAIQGRIWPVDAQSASEIRVQVSQRIDGEFPQLIPVAETTAAANGEYHFRGLTPGTYRIFATDGLHTEDYPKPITVQPSATTTNIDIIFGADHRLYLPILQR